MLIDRQLLASMLQSVATVWRNHTAELSEIDSRFGDGDHGVTIGKIAAMIEKKLAAWQDESLADFISDLGTGILGVNGGSAGPLYGTLVEGLAGPLGASREIDAAMLKAMFASSRDELSGITKAQCGDKTMMDALIPAVEAARKAEGDLLEVLSAAAHAAGQGAQATKNMVSKYGRARSYGEQTLGSPDAGATSTALFFEGLYQGVQKMIGGD